MTDHDSCTASVAHSFSTPARAHEAPPTPLIDPSRQRNKGHVPIPQPTSDALVKV
jgi:hypothetical protein